MTSLLPRRRERWRHKSLLKCLRHSQIVVHQWERSDALAGRRKDCVEHCGCGDADRRLADATPEAARWHDDRLDLRHLRDAHRVVIIEVGQNIGTALNRSLGIEQSIASKGKKDNDRTI